MSTHDITEWVCLNIASIGIIALPGLNLPAIEHGIEFGIKVLVGMSVVVLNIYKFLQARREARKPKTN